MLHGETSKIRELSMICKENGGAYLKIAPYYVKDEPNLMLTVGPDNSIKISLVIAKKQYKTFISNRGSNHRIH